MTGNEKKIAKIFSFIAWMPVKLKFYPMCGGLVQKFGSNL